MIGRFWLLFVRAVAGFAAVASAIALTIAPGLAGDVASPADRLLRAYPDALERIEANSLIWRDGTRMEIDDGRGEKPFDLWLDEADLDDMFRFPYPAGAPADPPAANVDPGRARNTAFFEKMYGPCHGGARRDRLSTITWLPTKDGRRLQVTTINGVDKRLAAISSELDALPATFDVYLRPPAGTLNCRTIAGTNRTSAHSYGIAIDIALKHAHYWRNARPADNGLMAYKNEIPAEIVQIFEKHGFIWGGRWYHYDTMHFEYRPELLLPPDPAPGSP